MNDEQGKGMRGMVPKNVAKVEGIHFKMPRKITAPSPSNAIWFHAPTVWRAAAGGRISLIPGH
jgi:hypothetical protein